MGSACHSRYQSNPIYQNCQMSVTNPKSRLVRNWSELRFRVFLLLLVPSWGLLLLHQLHGRRRRTCWCGIMSCTTCRWRRPRPPEKAGRHILPDSNSRATATSRPNWATISSTPSNRSSSRIRSCSSTVSSVRARSPVMSIR